MGAYYVYLVSSLPALNFSSPPPFREKDFFLKCQGLIPEKDIEILRGACDTFYNLESQPKIEGLNRWTKFELSLRNELVRARASRKKIDPLLFVRQPDESEAYASHVAMAAYRCTSLLEGEKILDQARWDFLDFLSFGHYFDFDFLLSYVLKLKILERWDKIERADKESLFSQTIAY